MNAPEYRFVVLSKPMPNVEEPFWATHGKVEGGHKSRESAGISARHLASANPGNCYYVVEVSLAVLSPSPQLEIWSSV